MERAVYALAGAVLLAGCAVLRYPQGQYALLVPSGIAYDVEVIRAGVLAEDCRYLTGQNIDQFPSFERVTSAILAQAPGGQAVQNLKVEITTQYRFFGYNCIRAVGDVVRLAPASGANGTEASPAAAPEFQAPSVAADGQELVKIRAEAAEQQALDECLADVVEPANATPEQQCFYNRERMKCAVDSTREYARAHARESGSGKMTAGLREFSRDILARIDSEYAVCMDQVRAGSPPPITRP
jgi:hypothetical protein